MGYRLVTDETVEPYTVRYLRKLGHDVERSVDVETLGVGADDRDIAAYARHHDRIVLTQDDDFFTDLDVDAETAGVLYQKDQTLSGKQVGDIVEEIATYVPRDEVVLEYVSENWL